MSRAYRIRVQESLIRDLQAEDSIETKLEILGILPPEQMGELLAQELEQRGFERQDDGTLLRHEDNGTCVEVEPCTGKVIIRSESKETVTLEGSKEGYGYEDFGPRQNRVKENLSRELQEDLAQRAERHQGEMQTEASNRLQKELEDLQPEVAEVIHRVTAEALKRKASQMGEIKEISEDPESGSLTIKVEV
ncbi:MAG TPA: hypothetical protein VGZ47_05680 [Gemmataceae bacterium]|jgi:hypothetical protein|nr:hypothetical protein [Gemmataceae bacterium]